MESYFHSYQGLFFSFWMRHSFENLMKTVDFLVSPRVYVHGGGRGGWEGDSHKHTYTVLHTVLGSSYIF